MDNPLAFGRLLKDYRRACDLTQEQLAEHVSCSVETIKKLETGKLRPSKQLAELLATQLAISPTDRVTFINTARAQVDRSNLPARASQPTNVAPRIQPIPQAGFAQKALPTGMVTFLFTDIEGSTRLWEQHTAAMRSALAHHDAILRHTISAHNGIVFKTSGDGVHAAFPSAPDSLIAALAAQRAIHIERSGGQSGHCKCV